MKKMEKLQMDDTVKIDLSKLEFFIDPDNPASASEYSKTLLSSRMDVQTCGSSG
jgi:hypothetical protein